MLCFVIMLLVGVGCYDLVEAVLLLSLQTGAGCFVDR